MAQESFIAIPAKDIPYSK